MKMIRIAETLLIAGLLIGLFALMNPKSLPIIIFMSFGHLLIVGGIIIYARTVWKDLKQHKVL